MGLGVIRGARRGFRGDCGPERCDLWVVDWREANSARDADEGGGRRKVERGSQRKERPSHGEGIWNVELGGLLAMDGWMDWGRTNDASCVTCKLGGAVFK